MQEGQQVHIHNLSKDSYFLTKQYQGRLKNPLIVCPCNFKEDVDVLTIQALVEDFAILVSVADTITFAYLKDLRLI